jgi:EAL domain-containing protein (putative c-di-GMP-specific phosphodiesterase class I)/GGDEF domain-containing protein
MHRAHAPVGPSPAATELPSSIVYALQPIVDIHSGAVYGFEALVRGTDAAGYASIADFFDAAAAAGRLWPTEQALHRLALATFRRLPAGFERKLFLNIDNRVFGDPAFDPAMLAVMAAGLGVTPSEVAVEISEQHATVGSPVDLAVRMRRAGLTVALDDFGQGFSELKLLHDAAPEYVKIDRFYVSGVAEAPRKRLFLSTMVNLAHVLGARVVAEGVETAAELETCRDVGCDLVQGWLVARPLRDLAATPAVYPLPARPLPPADDRLPRIIADLGPFPVPPIAPEADVVRLIERFAAEPELMALPVVDADGRLHGIVTERDFRAVLNRRFRAGDAAPATVASVTHPAPVLDAGAAVDSLSDWSEALTRGLVVTRDDVYAGYLPPRRLADAVSQRRLARAADQNPLSRLPGKASVNAELRRLGIRTGALRILVSFDFNHFKAFNDVYGFRAGDRAIELFAAILRRRLGMTATFLGHIGGDDFFAAFVGVGADVVERMVDAVLADFRAEVEALYDADDRDNGFLMAENRSGEPEIYPLMTCSAALMLLPEDVAIDALDTLARSAAATKRAAKLTPSGRLTRIVSGTGPTT